MGVPVRTFTAYFHKNDIEDMENLSTTSNYIMGFNEPDIGSQANMKSFVGISI